MKKKNCKMALAVFCGTAMLCALTAQAAGDLEKESQEAVTHFLQKDSTLKGFMDNAAGHAVFPNVGKGGLVVGGAHGDGVVYEKDLGPTTAEQVKQIELYNPDETWNPLTR